MGLVFDAPLLGSLPSAYGFGMQANGVVVSGAAAPQGVAGRIMPSSRGLHVTLVEGDESPTPSGGFRSECYTQHQALAEVWIVADVMIPATWALRDKGLSVFQLIQTPAADAPEGRDVTMVILVAGDEFVVQVAGGTEASLGVGSRVAGSAKVSFGKWQRFCWHIKWAYDASGFREVFCDGVPLLREFSCATAYDRASNPYFKFGIYNFTGFSGFGVREALFRNVKIWDDEVVGYGRAMEALPIPGKILHIQQRKFAFDGKI